jgi:UDP-N-acetyl-D-mannosaminuronic acid dehydrogenase
MAALPAHNFKYDVCIVGGLGHIGLPMGISLAREGLRVILNDENRKTAEVVLGGNMPFMENGAQAPLREVLNKTLFVSHAAASISEARYVIIVVGTPVDEHLNPNFTQFKNFFEAIMGRMSDSQHIILRSTVYPGTTSMLKDIMAGAGKKTMVSFCPERIAEGKAMEELKTLPQIIGAFDQAAFQDASTLFKILTNDTLQTTPIEAELSKLFTNVWRYVQFAISNQFYQIATQNGVDFYRIHEAVTHNYPRAAGLPTAGFAAGPCLFKDTMQLAAFSNNNFFLGHAAMLVNEGLPNFIVQRLKNADELRDKTVGLLGMAFKGDIDDPRESLSYKLKKILRFEAASVLCTDPFVSDPSLVPLETVLEKSDVIIVGAPHSSYRALKIDRTKTHVVDVWNLFGNGGYF